MTDLDVRAREFLVLTSILESLTGALADAVTGGDDGALLLERLWRSNRFVVALDDERRWYRYHHLLREFLQAELSLRGADALAAGHLRASEWLAAAGMVPSAIGHALDGGDLRGAALLLDAHRVELLDSGLARTILGWLSRLPDEVVIAVPRLASLATSALRLVDAPASAYQRWESLVRAHPELAAAVGYDGERMPLNLFAAADLRGDVGQAVAAAREALSAERIDSPGWYYSQSLLARALLFDAGGDSAAGAERAASAALQATHVAVAPSTRWMALSVLALRRVDEHDLPQAASLAGRALTEVVNERRYGSAGTDLVHIALGRCRGYEGDFEAARAELEFALSLHRARTPTVGLAYNLIAVAEVAGLAGDTAAWAKAVDEARALIAGLMDAGRLPELLTAADGSELPAATTASPPQLTAAEARVLRLLPTSLSQRDIGRELYLSANTVKSHTRSLYRKLGVRTRGDAVVAARLRGWLG
jgi:LuxR family maltose regulon positive regulatory protein